MFLIVLMITYMGKFFWGIIGAYILFVGVMELSRQYKFSPTEFDQNNFTIDQAVYQHSFILKDVEINLLEAGHAEILKGNISELYIPLDIIPEDENTNRKYEVVYKTSSEELISVYSRIPEYEAQIEVEDFLNKAITRSDLTVILSDKEQLREERVLIQLRKILPELASTYIVVEDKTNEPIQITIIGIIILALVFYFSIRDIKQAKRKQHLNNAAKEKAKEPIKKIDITNQL